MRNVVAWVLQLAGASGAREMVKVGMGAGRGWRGGAGEVGRGGMSWLPSGFLQGLLVPAMSFPNPCLLTLSLLGNQCQQRRRGTCLPCN